LWAAALTAAVLFLGLALPAAAQTGYYTTGSIAGTVRDNTGAGLPGVTVKATSLDTAVTRTTYTGKDGEYDFTLLPPGDYKIVAELQGLGSATAPRVTVLLGNMTKADLKLTPQVTEAMTVTAAAPVIDTQRTAMTQSVTNKQIDSLPLLGRDFRTLAMLTPGVSIDSYTLAAITANGARPLSSDFNIDGASSNNDFYGQQTGGTRPPFTFSQAAMKEFQVIRTQYDAEYGRGVGAAVNAITKSGTNDFHGSVFYYDRTKAWSATRTTVIPTNIGGTTYNLPISDSYLAKTVTQPGFVFGGPIIRDKLFFFVGADSMKQSQPAVIGNDMTQSSQFLALTAAQQQQVLSTIQNNVGGPYSAGLNYNVDNKLNTYLVKLDGYLGANNHWSLRDNITNYWTADSGSTTTFGLNQTNETDKFWQAVFTLDSVFSSNMFNQLILQSARDQRPVTSVYGGTEFSINWGSTQYFGFNDTTPSTADEKKFQFKDTVQFELKNNSLKVGAELLHRHLFDAFPRYAAGYFAFSSLINFVNNVPNTFQQAYGPNNGNVWWDTNWWSGFVNDTIHLSPRLTVDIGLRYDYESTPRPPANAYPAHPEFLTQITDRKNNFAPRVSFAWDVMGNGQSVLRGGWGKFFEYMPDILLASPIQGISGALITTTFTCTTTPSNPCPTYPAIMTPSQFLALSKLGANVVLIGSDYTAQQAARASLQYEQRIGSNYSLGVSAVYSHLTHIEGTKNINVVPTGYSLGNMPVYDYNSSANAARPYNDLGIIRALTSAEESWYRAQTIEFHRLATADSKLSWDISYTHSDSVDEETNTRSTSTTFLIDPNNPKLSEGPSDNDVKHRVVGDVIYRLPWGFEAALVASWHSGFPYTAAISFTCSGCTANSLTGQAQTSQAANFTPVFVDGNGNVIDITQATGMTLPQFSTWLAGQNARLIGRNTLRQPSVYDADLRISKTFNLGRGMNVQVLAEVFNVLNHNIWVVTGANQDMFRVTYTASTGKYTITKYTNTVSGTALNTFGLVQGYSGEVNPRQFQLAVKFNF
jgi:hypothetical protein